MKIAWLAPSFIVACIALGLVPLVAFAWQQGGVVFPDVYVWRVLRFTLLQAGLSTLLSVLPAIYMARALVRQRFWGRDTLLVLLALPLSMPAIVAIYGITAVYGASGLLGQQINLYGLSGILLAHVFFNMPLATRLFLQNLQYTPSESHRLAAQLGLSDGAVFKHVDWPALKPALPRVAALVFLLCASSFVIVLIFGGAQATTLEVAIYQSLRMDFDVSRALTLTVIQIGLSAVLVWAAAKALLQQDALNSNTVQTQRYDGKMGVPLLLDVVAIVLLVMLEGPILLSVFVQGITHINLSPILLTAILTSFGLAILTSIFTLPLAWALAKLQTGLPAQKAMLTAFSLAGYIVPPAVIATGWFLAFRQWDGGVWLAVVLIAVMNGLMALPFLMTVLTPAMALAAEQSDRLCDQLNVQGWHRFHLIDLPMLRGPISQSVMMTLVLSMGDLTAVTLLGSQGLVTLPSLVQQQMGHYQSDAAGGTALILGFICLGATFVAARFSRWA